jgi:predicted O-linked N-acetylglucosamine transferase (SPINDLY family)
MLMASVAETVARGWQYYQAGDLERAERTYREVLQVDPHNATVLYLLGTACQVQGRLDEAVANYEQALRFEPRYAEVHSNLGVAYASRLRWEDAIACYREARRHKPAFVDTYINMGVALTELGRLDEALSILRQAVRLRRDSALAYYNLGNALQKSERLAEAVESYQRALAFAPQHPDSYNNLARIFMLEGRLADALMCYRQALEFQPDNTSPQNNLLFSMNYDGAPAGSAERRRATHSNLLFCMNYDPRVTPAQLLEAHRHWAQVHAQVQPLGPASGHDRNTERRLRVGYLSPDFHNHPAASFLEPILTHHDRHEVETVCYAELLRHDAVTARLQSLAHKWRLTRGQSDAEVAAQIRADGIDVLIDLAGHASDSRMPVLAYKPAPVQATYLGYPNTTGLSTVDYLLTDAVADPPGEAAAYTEEPVRLRSGFCCYAPPRQAPEVTALPAQASKYVTFGSLQNLAKLNSAVLDLWCRLLRAIPSARLLIFRSTLTVEAKESLTRQFKARGMPIGRIDLHQKLEPATLSHLEAYGAVDISLDTFPWSGHTTACESLWMGVPVLTLSGKRHAARLAASVLTSVGLNDWIARTPDQFVEIGVRRATDLDALARLRSGLRRLVQTSPLCDGKTFTRNLEATYRALWRRWCEQ